MKLLRIALTDFRGVEQSEVMFDAPGITVVVGPNEIGKSSLPEALRLIRDFKDSSRHRDVLAVKPTHRDVGPRVQVEVQTGPYHFTYTKQWVRKASTELHVHAPRREQLTGDQAHERVEQIFHETLDPELWRALQQAQGDSLQQPALAQVRPLHAALSTAADTGDAGEAHSDLMARIEVEYQRYFTRTGVPSKEYARARDAVGGLETAVADLEQTLRSVDSVVDRHARLKSEHQRLEARATHDAELLVALEHDYQAVTSLVREHEQAEAQLREASLAAEAARQAGERRDALVFELTARREEAEKLAEALAGAEAMHTAGAATVAEHERERAEHRERVARERGRVDHARAALTRARARVERDSLVSRVDAARTSLSVLERCERALAANRVDQTALRLVADADADVRTARAVAVAGAARLTISRLGDEAVLLDGAVLVDDASLDVVDDAVIEVAGVLRVLVAPDQAAAVRGDAVRAAEIELAELLETYGVPDLAAARDAAASHDDTVRERDAARLELDSALAGESLESLLARSEALTAEAVEAVEGSPTDLEQVLADAVRDLEQAEHEAEHHALQRERHAEKAQHLLTDVVRSRVQLEGVQHDIARLESRLVSEREAVADVGLEAAVQQADEQVQVLRARVVDAEHALHDADAASLELRLGNLRESVRTSAAEVARNERERATAEGELEARGRDGLRDKLDAARSELADARRLYDSLHARAEAARLLFVTMSEHQKAARQRYVAPFREAIQTLGRVVFGPGLEVAVSDDLAIESRTLDGATVPFESLSGGAREQLAVIGRLATARLVSADAGAPVVLDDSLGFSDAERRRRLAAVLKLVGSEAQIIILTCEPERFADIGGATTVHLGS